jgi:hypothetical protein
MILKVISQLPCQPLAGGRAAIARRLAFEDPPLDVEGPSSDSLAVAFPGLLSCPRRAGPETAWFLGEFNAEISTGSPYCHKTRREGELAAEVIKQLIEMAAIRPRRVQINRETKFDF